jgi:adenylate cyclase
MPIPRTRWVLLAGVLALAIGATLFATDALRRLELLTVDMRFDARGAQTPPDDIVIVGIDDRTFSDFPFVPYPLPRRHHARVIRRLVAAGAKVIVYDIQFTEPSNSARDDNELVDSVAGARNRIVLATTETDGAGGTRVLGGDDLLRDIGARAGNAVVPADANGVIRRTPYEIDGLRALPVVAAELATRRPVDEREFEDNSAWIDFHGPPGTLTQYSFSAVERGRVPAAAFRDKIVVVGAMAPSLQDVSATSTSGDELMSGPEIQAEAISTILRGFPVREAPSWVGWLLVVGLGLFPVLAGLWLRPLRGLLAAVLVAALFAAGAYAAFRAGVIVPLVAPPVTLAASAVAVLAVLAVFEAIERRRIRDVFARFVPERVVDEVLEKTGDDLRLGGVRRECTVMFSDLRGFTAFSEGMPPDAVIGVLNDYLAEMSDAILDHGGTLITYLGDGIMSVFGAPLDQPDHRDRALAAAREMLDRLERFNGRGSNGRARDFHMGIGINTGPAMCGNVGSARRLEYAAIGDTTNTAARLEAMTKGSGYAVFVADSTHGGLASPPADLEFVDDLAVRGRRSTVRIWGLREPQSDCSGRAHPLRSAEASFGGGNAMNQARLHDVPFFSTLKSKELAAIAQQVDEIDVPAGKVLARQGELGHEFFVIESGTAEVTQSGQRVNELGPGDFFGEMALLEEDRRTATVTATAPMRLLVMTRASFRAIDRSMPTIHAAVRDAIEQRRTSVT